MHDPLVMVADIKRPSIRRYKPKMYLGSRDRKFGPIALKWLGLIDIWHHEPNDRDAFSVCREHISPDDYRSSFRHQINPFVRIVAGRSDQVGATREWVSDRRWQYHLHHWQVRVWPAFYVRRWLRDRCGHCGRRFGFHESPIGHGWDSPTSYHSLCSTAITTRRRLDTIESSYLRMVRRMQAELDWSDEDILAEVYQRPAKPDGYGIAADAHVLSRLLGWKFNNDMRVAGYQLVHPDGRSTQPHVHRRPARTQPA